MRKNTIRKIVHGMLDLLPLFVIPIFAIYSRNENAQFGYEVTQEVNKAVNFNQQIVNGNFSTGELSPWYFGTTPSYTIDQNKIVVNATTNSNYLIYKWDSNLNDIYVNRITIYSEDDVRFTFNGKFPDYRGNGQYTDLQLRQSANATSMYLVITPQSVPCTYTITNFNVYNLTQMYGSGNEPTLEDFNAQFTGIYYPYTESQEVIIENYETITYNDTDIGSQMVYTLYNTVDKYFNMNNVFGMHDLYNWFEINIFHQTSPLGIYIVWNIVLYEFVMDLLMLLYALFMFFIDMCKKLIEAPVNAIK